MRMMASFHCQCWWAKQLLCYQPPLVSGSLGHYNTLCSTCTAEQHTLDVFIQLLHLYKSGLQLSWKEFNNCRMSSTLSCRLLWTVKVMQTHYVHIVPHSQLWINCTSNQRRFSYNIWCPGYVLLRYMVGLSLPLPQLDVVGTWEVNSCFIYRDGKKANDTYLMPFLWWKTREKPP